MPPAPPAHVGTTESDDPETAHISAGRHHSLAHLIRRAPRDAGACRYCRDELIQTRRVIAALAEVRAALASVEPARGAWVEVRGKIAAERERRERTTQRWRIVTGIATAAAALLLTVSVAGQYGGIDALGPLAVATKPDVPGAPAAAALAVNAAPRSAWPSAAKLSIAEQGDAETLPAFRPGPMPDGLHLALSAPSNVPSAAVSASSSDEAASVRQASSPARPRWR